MNDEPQPNMALPNLSLQVTAAFCVLAVITYLLAPSLDLVFAVISAILFFVGAIILGLGFWNGIQRSRIEDVKLAGLLCVDTSHVPSQARKKLWLAIVLQIVVSFGIAALRPFTQQAFGTLVPTLGIGVAALWGSRFAKFFERDFRR